VAGAFGREGAARRDRQVGPSIVSTNPATGKILESFERMTPSDIEARLASAAEAFARQRRSSFADRARGLTRVADLLDAERDAFARLMTTEMGKPISAAADEVRKCARGCRYYAEHAERFLVDQPGVAEGARTFVRYQPLGVVLAVMPWNFPFWQVIRFAAPALMAGNVGLLKHASSVPRCALTLEDLFRRAGFGDGVFQTLLIDSEQVAAVVDDPRVAAVTLTGSDHAGSAVAARAGGRIKKTVLELGGSDPFIVMPSADVDEAARVAVQARTVNNGQSCIAAKRFLVADAVYAAFAHRFVAGMEALRVGDPLDAATDLGPLATEEILAGVEDQVRRSVAAGATVLTGGCRLDRPGNFYAPTVLADVPRDAAAWREEVFGPVAALCRVRDADEAIALANDTVYGLGASAWTQDAGERARFVDEIDSGLVFINAMVASDPALPFGGVKRSGYGRELGPWGLREFVNVKTIWIRERPRQESPETE
jgi:succinate-semialdehyde dehydrogenase/glutarate-semialdehyde dehydrogenase